MAEKKKDASKARPARNPRMAAPPPQNPDTFMLDPNWKGPMTAGQAQRKAAWDSLREWVPQLQEQARRDGANSGLVGVPLGSDIASIMKAQAAAVNTSGLFADPRHDAVMAAYAAGDRYPPWDTLYGDDVVANIQKNPPQPLRPSPQVQAQAEQRAKQRKRAQDMALQREITQQQSVPQTSLRAVLWGQ